MLRFPVWYKPFPVLRCDAFAQIRAGGLSFLTGLLERKFVEAAKGCGWGISRQATVVAPCHAGIGGEGGIDSGHPWPSPYGRLLRRRLPGLSCPVIEPWRSAPGFESYRSLRQIRKSPAMRGFFVSELFSLSGHVWLVSHRLKSRLSLPTLPQNLRRHLLT